jgi:hypothetical protein
MNFTSMSDVVDVVTVKHDKDYKPKKKIVVPNEVWKKEGVKTLDSLNHSYQRGLNAILGPHRYKKQICKEIESVNYKVIQDKKDELNINLKNISQRSAFINHSGRLLYTVSDWAKKRYTKKANVIRLQKFVLRELKQKVNDLIDYEFEEELDFISRSRCNTRGSDGGSLRERSDSLTSIGSVGSIQPMIQKVDEFIPLPLNRICISFTRERKRIQLIEEAFVKYIPIQPVVIEKLHAKMEVVAIRLKKLDLIQNTLAKVKSIPFCKSMQHNRPTGCPMCGLVQLGGEREEYTKSISRENGVSTLVLVTHELEALAKEEEVQLGIYNEANDDLLAYKLDIFTKVVINIQTWYPAYSAKLQIDKEEMKRSKSLFYYRVRRLVFMKRYIDEWVGRENFDIASIYHTYSELRLEAEEYVAFKVEDSARKTKNIAIAFCRKLKKRVYATRSWKQKMKDQEAGILVLHQKRALKQQKEREISDCRRRVQIIDDRKKQWFCVRPECEFRHFLSDDRYKAHMAIHVQNDVINSAKTIIKTGNTNKNLLKEKEFLLRLKEGRLLVQKPLPLIEDDEGNNYK